MPKGRVQWLLFSGMVAVSGYGLLLLVLSWLHIDPCKLHLPHRKHEDQWRTRSPS